MNVLLQHVSVEAHTHTHTQTLFFSLTCPHPSQHLFISVLPHVLLSAAVIITWRSSSSSDSVTLSPPTPQLAVLRHSSERGHLINLSLQVQLGESDKLGGQQAPCIIKRERSR